MSRLEMIFISIGVCYHKIDLLWCEAFDAHDDYLCVFKENCLEDNEKVRRERERKTEESERDRRVRERGRKVRRRELDMVR